MLTRLQLKACLHPLRLRILEAISRVPGSSLSLAMRLGDSQPRVHYHLRQLERAGLARLVEERRKRGVVERLYGADPEVHAMAVQAVSGTPGQLPFAPLLQEATEAANRPDAFMVSESRVLRLSRAQAKRLGEDLLKLLREYLSRPAPEGENYRAAFLLFPR